jgi:hypothetical protein
MLSSKSIEVVIEDWEEQIRDAWADAEFDFVNENFLDTIWEMSLTAFDIGREVQVVIDGRMNIFISAGDPGFVWFEEMPTTANGVKMKLPIECWIHTHPFGQAYFSGTDWNTIRTWEPVMNYAIVLGDNQSMEWRKGETQTVFYQRVDYPDWVSGQTVLEDFMEEEE